MNESKKFTNYIEKYKKLPIKKKKELLLEEFKKTLAFIELIKTSLNIKSDILYNREILDFTSGEAKEEDLVEAIYVYLISIREGFSECINKSIDK